MAWLSRFIAAILVSVITIAFLAQIFNATLLNSNYLNSTAIKADTYSQLSVAATNQLVKNAGQNSNGQITEAQARADISKVLTPQLIQTKAVDALNGIEAYYKNNGSAPEINLTDVVTQLQANGLPIKNDNSQFNPIIKIPTNNKIRVQVGNFEKVRTISTILAIVLLGLLIFLSWEEHRWRVIPDLGIIVGLLLGVYSVLFLYGVTEVEKLTKVDINANDMTTIANNYAKQLTHQIGTLIAFIAVTLLIISIAGRILLQIYNKPTKNNKTSKPKVPTKK